MVRVPTHRTPTHPGEMLLEEFLDPMGITQRELADRHTGRCGKIHPCARLHLPPGRVEHPVDGFTGFLFRR